jgi:exodeoxyribonuclease-3
MKIITYNVNGIRSAMNKDWLAWLQATDADVVCLQEIKATPDVLTDLHLVEQLGYQHYWFPAEKKGYSGTAILTKRRQNMWNTAAVLPILTARAATSALILMRYR